MPLDRYETILNSNLHLKKLPVLYTPLNSKPYLLYKFNTEMVLIGVQTWQQ